MSYDSFLPLSFGKRPIWLYEFKRGGVTTRLCSALKDYTDTDAVTWTASPVTHARFRITSALNRVETSLVFPGSDTFARTYLGDLGYDENTVTIYREFRDQTPPARVVKYRGRVIGAKPLLTRLTLTVEDRVTELRGKGLSWVMQRECPHALYHSRGDYGCKLNIADWLHSAEVSAISGNEITVDSVLNSSSTSASDPTTSYVGSGTNWFAGGVIRWDGKQQHIAEQNANVLRFLSPIPGFADAVAAASPGTLTVELAPGCNRTRDDCAIKFQNLENYGGFPELEEAYSDGRQLV